MMQTKTTSLKLSLALLASIVAFISLCLSAGLHAGLNADVLYPYSLARDLWMGIPILHHWVLPANPYFFPDVLITLLIVLIWPQPIAWYYLSGIAQAFTLIFVVTSITRSYTHSRFITRFICVIYVALISYLIANVIFHKIWTTLAIKIVVIGHHFFAGIIVLGLFFWNTPEKSGGIKMRWFIFNCLIMLATAFSDPFTLFYFSAFILGSGLIHRKALFQHPRWWYHTSSLLFMSLLGVTINFYFNASLMTQVHDASHANGIITHIKNFIALIGWRGIVLFYVLPCIAMALTALCHFTIAIKRAIWSISLGCLIVSFIVMCAGLIEHIYHLRYLGLYYPAIICVLCLMFSSKLESFLIQPFVSIVVLIAAIINCVNFFPNSTRLFTSDLQAIISCNELNAKLPGSTIIATYWPAKVIFELNDRQARLLQVKTFTPNIRRLVDHWMYNIAWANFPSVSSNKARHTAFVIPYKMSPTVTDQVLASSNAKLICHGHVIEIYAPLIHTA